MINHIETPEPSNSGTDGSQAEGDLTSELIEARPLEGLQIAQAIEGLAASNTRAFGGEVASALIAGVTSQLASELQYTKQDVTRLRNEIDVLKESLSGANIQKAVLEERIESYRSNRHLKNLGIFLGTTLLGVGIQLFKNELDTYGYASLIFGALLLGMCWYSAPKGGDK